MKRGEVPKERNIKSGIDDYLGLWFPEVTVSVGDGGVFRIALDGRRTEAEAKADLSILKKAARAALKVMREEAK